MFHRLEGKYQPLAPFRVFLGRMGRCFLATLAIVAFSLMMGASGYHYLGGLAWLDAFVNASMILTGMGPVDPMQTTEGKLFSIFYSLYSGVAFLTLIAFMVVPIYHRVLHRFHLDDEGQPDPPPNRSEPPTIGTNL